MKYQKAVEQANGWTDWIQPQAKGYRMGCCDCGLVHGVDFRIYRGRVQLRVQRLNRSTAMKRRWMKRRAEQSQAVVAALRRSWLQQKHIIAARIIDPEFDRVCAELER